jgi:hypothetical protein
MSRDVDLAALSEALSDLKRLPFPGHPADPDLADWILELAELDGYLVGLATTAVASRRPEVVRSEEARHHEAVLNRMGAVGDDEPIYDDCRSFIGKLVVIERILTGLGQKEP